MARALAGKNVCAFHCADPELQQRLLEGRRQGGVSRSKTAAALAIDAPDAPLATVSDVAAFLAQTCNLVRKGRLDVKIANAIGVLASTLLRALEGAEVEARIDALEARLT